MKSSETIRRCRDVLSAYYSSKFCGLVVYGSTARKQATPQSDIDLLVLLKPPFDYFLELRRLVDLLYPIQLESEQLISAQPAAEDEYKRGSIQLYRNAQREGVLA